MTPNRIVAVAASVIALALGILPVVGNFDWTSTAGVIAGITAVLGITLKWLTGWQAHEARSTHTLEPPVGRPSVAVNIDSKEIGAAIAAAVTKHQKASRARA